MYCKAKNNFGVIRNFLIFKNHKVKWDPMWRISIHRDFDSLGVPFTLWQSLAQVRTFYSNPFQHTVYALEWMGVNFYDYDDLQPKISPPKHFSWQCRLRSVKCPGIMGQLLNQNVKSHAKGSDFQLQAKLLTLTLNGIQQSARSVTYQSKSLQQIDNEDVQSLDLLHTLIVKYICSYTTYIFYLLKC